jgi:hypothetical protein
MVVLQCTAAASGFPTGGHVTWKDKKDDIECELPGHYTVFKIFDILNTHRNAPPSPPILKVHKIEIFFGSEFEYCTISLLVLLKY